MENNTFQGNIAFIKGGGLYYDQQRPIGLHNVSNKFFGNQAPYGSDFASYPTKMMLTNINGNQLQRFVSGGPVADKIDIGLYD